MEMNPAKMDGDAEVVAVVGPAPSTGVEEKFMELAKRIKKLSPETLEAIKKDLGWEEKSAVEIEKSVTIEAKPLKVCECGKDDCPDCPEGDMPVDDKDPRVIAVMGLSKALGIPYPKK